TSCLEIFFFVQMQTGNIIGEHPSYVGPRCTSTNKIKFLIILIIVNNRVLVYGSRVTTCCVGNLYIRNARNHGPYAPGSTVGGRETSFEKNPFITELVEVWRCVQRVPIHRTFVTTERFAYNQYHVWF